MGPLPAAARVSGNAFHCGPLVRRSLRRLPFHPSYPHPHTYAKSTALSSRSFSRMNPLHSTRLTAASQCRLGYSSLCLGPPWRWHPSPFYVLEKEKATFSSIVKKEERSIALANCCMATASPTAPVISNPKIELQDNQQIIDFSCLEPCVLSAVLPEVKLRMLKMWIDNMMRVAYDDFDERKGIVWDDYVVDISTEEFPELVSIDPVKKFVTIQGVNVQQSPKSIFSYYAISQMLLREILPPCFKAISAHTKLPQQVYMQTFVLRSLLSESLSTKKQHVRWHQDPSDYGNSVADYTMVLMLTDPLNPLSGWEGGEILVKNGEPSDSVPAVRIVPKYNQAILFNNKKNSHLVTAIKNAKSGTTRDVMIVNVYLKNPSLK